VWLARQIPHGRYSQFSRSEPLFFSFKCLLIYAHESRVDPVPDPLLLRKFGTAGNRTQDLWINSQELWTLKHRGGLFLYIRN
jgi:hypothetical protein